MEHRIFQIGSRDVYRPVEVESFDSEGSPCTMALVDGRHVLPSGRHHFLGYEPPKIGDTSELVGMNEAGEFVPKGQCGCNQFICEEGDLDDYLAMGVKSVTF